MATIAISTINSAIETALDAAVGISSSQDFDELKAGKHRGDLPLLQVYPESFGPEGRQTYGSAVHQGVLTFHVDLYGSHRFKLGQDMSRLVDAIEVIQVVFFAQQQENPHFGEAGIKAFGWSWNRVIFDDSGQRFLGARFIVEVTTF